MKFIVKNKLFSLGAGSIVTNEEGAVVYKIKGNFFSNILWGTHKKVVKEVKGKKLFVVRNKFWHKPFFNSALIFNAKKQKLAVVTKSHLIKNGYDVVGANELIKVEGSGWNLDIVMSDKKIGHISLPTNSVKNFFRLTDTYVLDVEDPEDASFLVAMMIAIDNIHDKK